MWCMVMMEVLMMIGVREGDRLSARPRVHIMLLLRHDRVQKMLMKCVRWQVMAAHYFRMEGQAS